MTDVRKVPAGDGAEWLLGGFALLRRAPLQLGLLGLIWGALSALASMIGSFPALAMWLLGPVLFAGLIHAAREVDAGRPAQPALLFHGLGNGRALSLLTLLLPQIGALLVMGVVFFAMLTESELQQITSVVEQIQANPAAQPELIQTLPQDKISQFFLLAMFIVIVAGLFTFVATPEILYRGRSGFAAMGASLRACLRNLPALLVMTVLLVITFIALSLAVGLVSGLLGWLIGAAAGQFVSQLLIFAVLMPVLAGLVYHAWRRMLGDSPVPPPVPGMVEA
ncbi:BPSS1780 family membrane protein [Cognatilysobacter bugurensis]|uniref:Transmembrane protein n=1 Tax=Cognatilysobacter bugurensis TaxID=543356 RepID=A0A918T3L2_9GAMM|nr:BPSS1780 family membrane protein [Lysobacter bugurensis]GHA87833.1 hypothetical protein GCM10007067_27340 [Lysobacter bugurensis]